MEFARQYKKKTETEEEGLKEEKREKWDKGQNLFFFKSADEIKLWRLSS